MDAGAMVRLAKTWKPVPIQHICTTDPGQSGVNPNKNIVVKGQTEQRISLDASNCDRVKFLEHLHLHIDLTSGIVLYCILPRTEPLSQSYSKGFSGKGRDPMASSILTLHNSCDLTPPMWGTQQNWNRV